jgi:RNAse (barnase) inhibitor barstar
VKIDLYICDDEDIDTFDDYHLDSPDTYYLGKKGADSCDEYWDELVGSN